MRNQIRTIVLLGALGAAFVGLGQWMGGPWPYVLGAGALLVNLGAWFFSDRVVLRTSGARELPRHEGLRLHVMVDELSARAGMPSPKLYVVDDPHPNAFATGRGPGHGAVAVTTGLLGMLDPRELRGVLAHEIAHIRNRDVLVATIAAGLAAALAWASQVLPFFGARPEDEESGPSPLAILVAALVAPIVGTLLQLGISRSREYLADAEGARLSGDPEALALALERLDRRAAMVPAASFGPATASLCIVSPLAGGAGLSALFSTHPPMAERVRRLRRLASGPRLAA